MDEVIAKDNKIVLVKWYDNKPVHIASNFVGQEPTDMIRRFDKKKGEEIFIPRPNIVRLYNECMGGVDHLDQMLTYYRVFIKSRKWTFRVIMHFFDLAIVASWMQYSKYARENGDSPKYLLEFKLEIAETLCRAELQP